MEVKQEVQDATLEQDLATLEAINLELSWVSHRRLEQELNAYGLTVPQFIALHCIEENEQGCSMTQLAESAYQVSATMTGIVDRLVDRGLVSRTRVPQDRRTLRVSLTQEGKELMQRINLHKRAWLKQFVSTLSPEDRRAMLDLSQRYLDVVRSLVSPE